MLRGIPQGILLNDFCHELPTVRAPVFLAIRFVPTFSLTGTLVRQRIHSLPRTTRHCILPVTATFDRREMELKWAMVRFELVFDLTKSDRHLGVPSHVHLCIARVVFAPRAVVQKRQVPTCGSKVWFSDTCSNPDFLSRSSQETKSMSKTSLACDMSFGQSEDK